MKSLLLSLFALSFIPASFAETAPPKPWRNSSEAGVVITGGNSQTSTVSVKEELVHEWGHNLAKLGASYLEASDRGTQNAKRWTSNLRYERQESEQLSFFVGQGLESDVYQNILQRYITDVGAKHFFQKNPAFNWFAELGYRFNRENYPVGYKNYHIVRAYNEMERNWTPTFSTKWWLEYLPNLTAWQAYQINSELSVSTIITDVFSLKSAYQIRYYNAPPANTRFKTDSTFTTALVAKF